MAFLRSLLGFDSDPSGAAQPYFERAGEEEKKYLSPFIERGQQAGDIYGGVTADMARDPTAFLNKLMESYKPSEQYQFMQDKMGQSASNTAAAGGMRGSPMEQQQQQELTQKLLSQDMQQFLQNLMGIEKTGLSGQGDIFGKGFQASTELGSDLANIDATEGSLAFQGERERGKRGQDLLRALTQIGGTAAGAALGGVPGAQVGASLGGGAGSSFFGGK